MLFVSIDADRETKDAAYMRDPLGRRRAKSATVDLRIGALGLLCAKNHCTEQSR